MVPVFRFCFQCVSWLCPLLWLYYFVPPSVSLVNSWCDDDGHFLQCEFSFHAKLFPVCCIYCPNRNPTRDQFLDDLHSRIDPLVPTILSGDFNSVVDHSLDRAGSDPCDSSRESSSSLLNLFDCCCVIDIWRYLHPSSSGFTWTRWNGSLSSRIDLFGVPYVWVPSVLSCNIVPCPFSDHCGVSVCRCSRCPSPWSRPLEA